MRKMAVTGCLAGMLVVCTAMAQEQGTFNKPADMQIEAAANNPDANLAALLKNASHGEAAQVVKLTLAKAVSLKLPPNVRRARIAAIINAAFGAIGIEMRTAFASALGNAVAGIAIIVATPGVVSEIQSAIATAGGTQGATIAQAFGSSYSATSQSTGGSSQTTENNSPTVTLLYEGQNL